MTTFCIAFYESPSQDTEADSESPLLSSLYPLTPSTPSPNPQMTPSLPAPPIPLKSSSYFFNNPLPCVMYMRSLTNVCLPFPTLLQDLTQDSATLTGWRQTKRSGEGKMIALYCPGIYCLRYRSFPWSTEVFRDQLKFSVIAGNFRRFFLRKRESVRRVGSNSLP
jgi:hypothetical protein